MIGTTISHYRILGQIGEGGMGVVYVAEDTRLGRRVAVKIPHAGSDERHYRSRFLREARAVSALGHKNIAAVYDYGETEEGAPFIVMELVTGQTLGELLMGTGLTLARAVEVIEQVAEALAEAHRRGIVHRDVKPSNVIINERGEVKVLDFGLAKQFGNGDGGSMHATHTRSDVIIGTPLYLSPEQARGAPVDGRSDLFALGALLYECVAGRPAFSGSNVIEIGAQVLHVDPPPPSQFNQRVPSELDRVTRKALAKRPEDRYQTAEEMAADLARVGARLSGEDTTRTRRLTTDAHLTRPSALNTIAEKLRRPRFSPLALMAALLALLLGVWAVVYFRSPSVHVPERPAQELFNRGVEAMREGAYYKASGLFQQAIEEDNKFALAHARLAEALTEMDYIDRATNELLTVRRLLEQSALPEQDRLYLDAVTDTAQRRYPQAVSAYQKIARLNPDVAHVYVDLGRAYDKNNETEKAVASYTEATTRAPGYAAAFLRLGVLHARQKNVPGALAAFDRAARRYAAAGNAEGEAEVHYQRGRLYVETNKMADARRELERALELSRATRNLSQQVQALFQLSHTERDFEQARALVAGAAELAQTSSMHDQAALGHIKLGQLYLQRNDHAEAERQFQLALAFARNEKVRRLEALALFHLSSLRQMQERPEEALRLLEQARDFYAEGGYRKESARAAQLIGRIKRQRGDYAGALETFLGLLPSVEQSGDLLQLGDVRSECGMVLLFHEQYPRALEHFDEALRLYRSLDNRLYAAITQVNRANALWRVGRYDEARAALDEVAAYAERPEGTNQQMLANLRLIEARMALSRLQLPAARAAGQQALTLTRAVGASASELLPEAGLTLCLAEALSGSHAGARTLCAEAVRAAEQLGDPWYAPNSRLALAEALLTGGDARGALDAAHGARQAFARAGRVESEWRALAHAGRAAQMSGDGAAAREHFTRAVALLSQLEQSWGAEAAGSYTARPDVQLLKKHLDGDNAAGSR